MFTKCDIVCSSVNTDSVKSFIFPLNNFMKSFNNYTYTSKCLCIVICYYMGAHLKVYAETCKEGLYVSHFMVRLS